MAGIGFRLRELAREDTAWASFRVYLFSALISSGPWVISVINLFLLSLWNPASISDTERATLFSLIAYAMAGSYVGVGTVSLAFTRFLADQVYLERMEKLLPALNGLLVLVMGVASVSGAWFLNGKPLPLVVKFEGWTLFMALCFLWVIMIYLSILRDYTAITWAFLWGAILGWVLVLIWGNSGSLSERLLGFTVGQLVTVFLLAIRIFKELGAEQGISFEFLQGFIQRPLLLVTGLCYNLGFWIDKFIFWDSRFGTTLSGFRLCPFYDTPLFMAQMTMIPTLTLFLVHIETNFFETYRKFYVEIIQKRPFSMIRTGKQAIHTALRSGLELIIKYQGMMTLMAIVLADVFQRVLHLDPAQLPLLRFTLLGAFVHSLLHVFIIFNLYFDLQEVTALTSVIFLAGISLFTALSVRWGLPTFGLGYLMGCLLALGMGYWGLDRVVSKLEFETFAKQPMASASE